MADPATLIINNKTESNLTLKTRLENLIDIDGHVIISEGRFVNTIKNGYIV